MSNIKLFHTVSHKMFRETVKKAVALKHNVIVQGDAGSGKTMIIGEVFDEIYSPEQWAYFSGPTVDPFIDFIGCPQKVEDEDGVVSLEMVRPKRFATDSIRAIFIDEYNRAPKQIKNAVMELLQKKSINGVKYNNLEVVFAAINPDEDEYDVEPMDKAQLDRFHIKLALNSAPNADYFQRTYGSNGTAAVRWWKQLNKDVQKVISSRCLEYALNGIAAGMPPSCYLPDVSKPSSLAAEIKDGPKIDKLTALGDDEDKIKSFLKNEKNYNGVRDFVESPENIINYLSLAPKTKIARVLSTPDGVSEVLMQVLDPDSKKTKRDKAGVIRLVSVLEDIAESGKSAALSEIISKNSTILESIKQAKD